MRHVVYVAERDGEYAAWRAGWKSQGYDLMPLNINEPDPQDGRVGRVSLRVARPAHAGLTRTLIVAIRHSRGESYQPRDGRGPLACLPDVCR